MKEVKAIIFDMDGLMLDTERLFLKAYQQAAEEYGFTLPLELYRKMLGHRADTSQQILNEGLPEEAPGERIAESARRIYHKLILEQGIEVMPGLIELLDFLDEIRMPRCVATSTHYELTCAKLESVQLLHRVEHVTCGDQVAAGKPAPDIFLKAAEKLGVLAEHCLVLEDSNTGIRAAHAAGMMPVWIPDLHEPTAEIEALAEAVFPSLSEFQECFRAVASPA